jgi:MFS family permease
MSFRREVFDTVGGFTDGLGRVGSRPLGCEETELGIRLRQWRADSRLVYEPAAIVRHHHRRDYAGLRRQVHDYGVGITAILTRYLLSDPACRRTLLTRAPTGIAIMFAYWCLQAINAMLLPFLLFLVAMVLAHLVYFAYEAVLPISAVDSYGLTPAAWGFLVIINPALVTIFQLRLTRRVERFPAAPKFALAMILMGWPFLLLSVNASIAILALVILIFVVGEMLWIPTSQAIAAGLAPSDLRGAYMGAFSSTSSVGFALGPFLGLQVRGEFGDSAMWGFFAGAAVVGAILGVIACRYAFEIRKARLAAA